MAPGHLARGSNTMLAGRFAAVRVRPAHRDCNRATPPPEEWLLVEWPDDEPEPTRYWLSTLPSTIIRRAMVDQAKLRWRIERDDQDLKQELGLGHYEGRGWRGSYHHAILYIAAYGFLIAERGAFPPPTGSGRHPSKHLPYPTITDPGALPIRPERHAENSMTTIRKIIARALARTLQRCPRCQRQIINAKLMAQ